MKDWLRVQVGLLRLSVRETEIVRWLADGKSNRELAVILDISEHTIKDHLKSIYRKFGVDNRTAAARLWRESALSVA